MSLFYLHALWINVREYRMGNLKWTIKRKWQHRAHKAKTSKAKTQHNMCWTPLCATKNTNNVNKTWPLLQTTGVNTGTCFIQKIYALSSNHLPFSPSQLRLNIFRLFVILSLTQLYRYTPDIFLFSTATSIYTYRGPLRRIGQEYSANVSFSIFQSLKRIQPLPVCARFFIHSCIRNSLDRPCVTMLPMPLKCKVSL